MTLRPSNLPKLAICACFEPNAEVGPEAARGTKLDCFFRCRVHGDKSDDGQLNQADLDAVNWAVDTLRAIAGTAEIITDEERCRIECLGLTGTADAWLPDLAMSADLKTGQIRNYGEQMAAYALGFMEATFCSEWTTHLLFCDQRRLITYHFTYDEAKAVVAEIIARFHDGAKQPTLCDYCSWCAKAETCEARLASVSSALTVSNPGFDFAAVLADNETLGRFLTACSVLDDFRERAEETARDRMQAGAAIPGWRLISKRGPEFVDHVSVGHYVTDLGFGTVLAAYGNLSAKKFRELWEQKMPQEKPFPEELIKHGKASFSLRAAKASPTTAIANQE